MIDENNWQAIGTNTGSNFWHCWNIDQGSLSKRIAAISQRYDLIITEPQKKVLQRFDQEELNTISLIESSFALDWYPAEIVLNNFTKIGIRTMEKGLVTLSQKILSLSVMDCICLRNTWGGNTLSTGGQYGTTT